METVLRRTGEGLIQLPNRYTKGEIEHAWLRSDNKARIPRTETFSSDEISMQSALEISALFIRRVHPDILCTHFDIATNRLKLFVGECDGIPGALSDCEKMIRAYQVAGADEGGSLFAQPGMFDIDVVELVRTMLEASKVMHEHSPTWATRMQKTVAKCYLGIAT